MEGVEIPNHAQSCTSQMYEVHLRGEIMPDPIQTVSQGKKSNLSWD